MKTSQFLLLIVGIIVCQIAGFAFVSARTQPLPLAGDLADINRQIQNALAELRVAQDSINLHSGSAVVALPDAKRLRETIRAVLESELRAGVVATGQPGRGQPAAVNDEAAGANSAGTAGSAAVDVAVDPAERTVAIRESNAIVQRALSSQLWTAADNVAILPYLISLPDADRVQIMTRIYKALERRELTLEPGQLPPM